MRAGKALQSKTPLKASAPLKRSSVPLKRAPMVQKRVKPKLTAAEKRPLDKRSNGQCEIGSAYCAYFATDVCHRRGEKAGGRHGEAARLNDRLSNVLAGCRPCHAHATLHPRTAELNGWRLLEAADPLTSRVNYRGRWALLDDEGGVTRL